MARRNGSVVAAASVAAASIAACVIGACATATTHDDIPADSGPSIQSGSSSSGGPVLSSGGSSGSGSGIQPGSSGGDDSGSVADGYFFTETGAPTNPCATFAPTCGQDAGALCTDLPTTKVIDTTNGATTPADAYDQFTGTATTSGGPCILEPQDGTLFRTTGSVRAYDLRPLPDRTSSRFESTRTTRPTISSSTRRTRPGPSTTTRGAS